MPEATSFGTVATIVAAIGAGTGAVALPALAAFGIDGYSVGSGLLGCVVVQVFAPPERVTLLRVATTAIGSVLVASFGAPFIAPAFKVGSVTAEHANAVASALLGGSAKPVVLLAISLFQVWFANWLPPAEQTAKTKGPEDA